MDSRHIMVVLIIAIVMIAGIFRARHGSRLSRWQEADPVDDAETQRLRDEVRTLKERVAVLERIATDSGTSLEREIEKLREQ